MRRRKPERHPNGYWYGHVSGKRINLGKNKRKAQKQLKEIEKELAAGRLEVGGRKTTAVTTTAGKDILVKELAYLHLNWVKRERAEGTFIPRQLYACRFIQFVGKTKMVSEVSTEDIEQFRHHERTQHSKGGPNAGNHAVRELKTMFLWGRRQGCYSVPMVPFPPTNEVVAETHTLSAEELVAIFKASDEDLRDLILFGLSTGLRPQEIHPLERDHIRRNGGGWLVKIQVHKTTAASKTPAPRSVPLCPLAREIVERQMSRHPQSRHIFLNGHGKPYTAQSLRQRFQRACRRAKVKPVRVYDLRHFFGTAMAEANTNLALLAQVMGHSRLQTTARYIANTDKAHREAVGRMGELLAGLVGEDGGRG